MPASGKLLRRARDWLSERARLGAGAGAGVGLGVLGCGGEASLASLWKVEPAGRGGGGAQHVCDQAGSMHVLGCSARCRMLLWWVGLPIAAQLTSSPASPQSTSTVGTVSLPPQPCSTVLQPTTAAGHPPSSPAPTLCVVQRGGHLVMWVGVAGGNQRGAVRHNKVEEGHGGDALPLLHVPDGGDGVRHGLQQHLWRLRAVHVWQVVQENGEADCGVGVEALDGIVRCVG